MLFVLLFIPMTSLANVDPEICFNIGNDGNLCNSTAGCFYDSLYPTSDKCRQCERGSYCTATETEPQPCTSPFTDSDLGATSAEECYQTINCRDYADESQECRHYNTNNGPYRCGNDFQIPAHIEGTGTQCYYNTRLCDKFGTPNECHNGTVDGAAFWNNDLWNIQACKCTQNNFLHQSCLATIEKKTTLTTQASAQGSITYDNVSYYYCTGCPAGSYVNPDTDFQTNSTCYTGPGSSSLIVCQCTESEQGFYSSGFTISYPIDNGSTSTYANPPYLEKCEFGKTTSDPGATSADDCEYTDQTKFCDAKGCFTLTQTELLEWGLINP